MLYAIHGNNPEIIRIIEENINYKNVYFKPFLQQSIRCHHNDVSKYILDNYENPKISIHDIIFNENRILFL